MRAIEAMDPDALLLIHFDKPFSEQSGESFVRHLAGECGRIHSVCVGADFAFGPGPAGGVTVRKRSARRSDPDDDRRCRRLGRSW